MTSWCHLMGKHFTGAGNSSYAEKPILSLEGNARQHSSHDDSP